MIKNNKASSSIVVALVFPIFLSLCLFIIQFFLSVSMNAFTTTHSTILANKIRSGESSVTVFDGAYMLMENMCKDNSGNIGVEREVVNQDLGVKEVLYVKITCNSIPAVKPFGIDFNLLFGDQIIRYAVIGVIE